MHFLFFFFLAVLLCRLYAPLGPTHPTSSARELLGQGSSFSWDACSRGQTTACFQGHPLGGSNRLTRPWFDIPGADRNHNMSSIFASFSLTTTPSPGYLLGLTLVDTTPPPPLLTSPGLCTLHTPVLRSHLPERETPTGPSRREQR